MTAQHIEEQVRILLCEDDVSLGSLLADFLHRLNFDVELCSNGEEGLKCFQKRHFDICLLDIFLTERRATEDIIRGYNLGCDDYLIKPCPMDILLCKIRAIMRRSHLTKKNSEVEFDLGNGVHFDSVRQMLGDEHLAARESELLLILCRNLNTLVERNVILRTIWSQDSYFASRSLSVYVNHLRKHLVGTKRQIIGLHGKGYKLVEV